LRDSGAKYVVVDTLEQARKTLAIIDELPELKKIFVMDAVPDLVHDRLGTYDSLLAAAAGRLELPALFERARTIAGDDVAAIIYTSGTTGRPKGVMLTNGNFLSQRVMLKTFNINYRDVFLNHLPFCHSFGMTADLLATAEVGATLAIADGIGAEQIRHALRTVRPTILMSVPRLFEKLYVEVRRVVGQRPERAQKIFQAALDVGKQVFDLKNERRRIPLTLLAKYELAKLILMKVRQQAGLDRVRVAYAGGGPTSTELCYFFQSLGIDIFQGYGLTETSPVANVNPPGKNKLGTVGPAIAGVEEKLALDGEILIRGKNLMKGYYNDPEATAEAIDKEGWFHTGDIGTIDADGYLTITDRKKELIVTAGGKNIAPLAIESAFNTERYIERVVAIGDRRKYIAALVCPNFDAVRQWAKDKGLALETDAEIAASPDVRKLLEECMAAVNAEFARYEQIKKFAVIDHEFSEATGELTPSMKVKRRVVAEKYSAVIDALYPAEE
jgi:long-chain acyl-CoA synthetase